MTTVPFIVNVDSTTNLNVWLKKERSTLDTKLDQFGAVLIRGASNMTEECFQEVVSVYCGQALEYMYRSTPRTHVGHNVYTATEYPPGLTIPFHSENAFQRQWPLVLLFCCLLPAENGGGQTPLVDIEGVTQRIDSAVRRRFLEKKVMYIRNYNPRIDLRWQTVFQTDSKAEVEAICKKRDIQFEWTGHGLRTRQVCQGLAKNPHTEKLVWFNQAHLFHPSSLDEKSRQIMLEMFKEEDLPRNARFGDDSPLDEQELAHIRAAYEAEPGHTPWHKGDILFVDNMRMAHGRTPYKGLRRVLVAMSGLHSPDVGKLD